MARLAAEPLHELVASEAAASGDWCAIWRELRDDVARAELVGGARHLDDVVWVAAQSGGVGLRLDPDHRAVVVGPDPLATHVSL